MLYWGCSILNLNPFSFLFIWLSKVVVSLKNSITHVACSNFTLNFIVNKRDHQFHLVPWGTRSPRSPRLLLRKQMTYISIKRASHECDSASNSVHRWYRVSEYHPWNQNSHRNLQIITSSVGFKICLEQPKEVKRFVSFCWLYLKVTSYIECDCCCGVNDVEDWEVKTKSYNTWAENNDESRPWRRVCFKPIQDPIAFE